MKISKLMLLISLSNGLAYSITESFDYSRFDIPTGTFDTKIESGDSGVIFTTTSSVYCYRWNGTVALTSATVKKIIRCAQGTCTETVYNTQTGQQIALEEADVTSITPQTSQESPKRSLKDAINDHRALASTILGTTVLVSGYSLYKLYSWVKKA